MQLIVAGFHRSGTSLLTHLLHDAGLFVGDRLLGAMPSNPYGHFEDRDFLELHRSILWSHGDDWQWDATMPFHVSAAKWREMRALARKRDIRHRLWGFKDPRVCLFMGHWKYLMPDAKAVIVYRDPADSVRSMESRQAKAYYDGVGKVDDHMRFFREPDHGLRVWNTYNKALVAYARAHLDECLVIPFSYLTDGQPVVDMINDRLGAGLEPVATEQVFDARATTRRDRPQVVFDDRLKDCVQETWAALEELTASTCTSMERTPGCAR